MASDGPGDTSQLIEYGKFKGDRIERHGKYVDSPWLLDSYVKVADSVPVLDPNPSEFHFGIDGQLIFGSDKLPNKVEPKPRLLPIPLQRLGRMCLATEVTADGSAVVRHWVPMRSVIHRRIQWEKHIKYKSHPPFEIKSYPEPITVEPRYKPWIRQPVSELSGVLKLNLLLQDYMWPVPQSNVPIELSNRVWQIAYNATDNLNFMIKSLEAARRAREVGQIPPEHYASLEDRVMMMQNFKQYYGTQVMVDDNNKLHTWPIHEPEKLNERRASLGLSPYEDYIREVIKYHEFNKIWPALSHIGQFFGASRTDHGVVGLSNLDIQESTIV